MKAKQNRKSKEENEYIVSEDTYRVLDEIAKELSLVWNIDMRVVRERKKKKEVKKSIQTVKNAKYKRG